MCYARPVKLSTRRRAPSWSRASGTTRQVQGSHRREGGGVRAGSETLAYTVGSHIAFAERKFAPATSEGRRLLAHELTHVIQQQAAAGVAPASEIRIGERDDRWERQADDIARQTPTTGSSPNKRMTCELISAESQEISG